MKFKLRAPVQYNSAIEQVLHNRGIEDIESYLKADLNTINQPEAFGEEKMHKGVEMVAKHIKNNDKTILIIDPDVDGNTSAAELLNYFYNDFPGWVTNIELYFHNGKQHGLNDCIDYIVDNEFKFVLCPDAGSNDTEECKVLWKHGIDILILDHHDFDKENPYALIINNQKGYSDYSNKALSGVGVVWQFCRYFDKIMGKNYADDLIDLVAIGLVGDMMDLRQEETKILISEGLKKLKNPFLYKMAQKNAFKLGTEITPMGAAFYIVPLLNAIQRSGTQEEKQLVFNSMLTYKAFTQVPSTKRGHKPGDMEQIVEQAVRTCTNVKNRQTRVQDTAVANLETRIEDEGLLDKCKVLILLLDENCDIPAEVRGLIANKFMSKYQRPCCILTKNEEYSGQTIDGYRYEISYAGSARGCSLAGIDDFKQVCLDTGVIDYAIGHPNAFGLKIYERDLPQFVKKINAKLVNMSDEPIYYVDYIFKGQNVDGNIILDISDMLSYWGTEIDEAMVAIEGLKVTPSMVDIFDKTDAKGEHHYTLKISLNNGINIMQFDASEEMCHKLKQENSGYIEVDIVGKCNKNEWNGNITPQIFIEDYNITDSNKYYF